MHDAANHGHNRIHQDNVSKAESAGRNSGLREAQPYFSAWGPSAARPVGLEYLRSERNGHESWHFAGHDRLETLALEPQFEVLQIKSKRRELLADSKQEGAQLYESQTTHVNTLVADSTHETE